MRRVEPRGGHSAGCHRALTNTDSFSFWRGEKEGSIRERCDSGRRWRLPTFQPPSPTRSSFNQPHTHHRRTTEHASSPPPSSLPDAPGRQAGSRQLYSCSFAWAPRYPLFRIMVFWSTRIVHTGDKAAGRRHIFFVSCSTLFVVAVVIMRYTTEEFYILPSLTRQCLVEQGNDKAQISQNKLKQDVVCHLKQSAK